MIFLKNKKCKTFVILNYLHLQLYAITLKVTEHIKQDAIGANVHTEQDSEKRLHKFYLFDIIFLNGKIHSTNERKNNIKKDVAMEILKQGEKQ